MTDLWGVEQPAFDVGGVPPAMPARLARLAEVQATGIAIVDVDAYAQGFPAAAELPEVQALMGQGWRPLDAAPLYCLLPAAWPVEHRGWVPDRLPRVGMGGVSDVYWARIAAIPADEDWPDDYPDTQARAAGLPDPPTGRTWLLRSPWPRIPVSVIYDIIWSLGQKNRTHDQSADMYAVATDVLTWNEKRALDACPAETRQLLDAWATAGRIGEEAADPIALQLHPEDLEDAMARTRLDEATLLAWLTSLQSTLDADTIRFIRRWRAADLPGNPPAGAHRYAYRDLDELRSWLGAGFDLYAADRLNLAGLDTAIRWRAAGFTEADTYELLHADPELTPQEALAFDAASVRHGRRKWIYYGFNASQAAQWAALGLTPSQARLWRACSKQPDDVQPGQQHPPQLLAGHSYIAFYRVGGGEWSNSEWNVIPDPPGTRGRHARRSAGDGNPWINTD